VPRRSQARVVARKATKRPVAAALPSRSAEVVLDLEVEGDRAELVLTNFGDAVATDVRVTFSRALIGLGGSVDLGRLPIFEKLGVLAPGRSLRIFWDAASALFADERASPFVATLTWCERSRPRQHAEYHHDPGIYRQLPTCHDAPRTK